MLNLINLFLKLLFFKFKLYFLYKLKELLFQKHFFLFNKFIELYNESSVSTEIKKYVFKETLDLNDELSGDSNFFIQPAKYFQYLKFFNTKLNYSQNYRKILRRRQYLRSLFFIKYKKKKLFSNDKLYLSLYKFNSLKKNYFFLNFREIFIEKFKLIYNGKKITSYLIFFFKFFYLLLKLLSKFIISNFFFLRRKKIKFFLFNNLRSFSNDSDYLKLRNKFFNEYIIIKNLFDNQKNIVLRKYKIEKKLFQNNFFVAKFNFFYFILNIFFYVFFKIFIFINLLWILLFYLLYMIYSYNFLKFFNIFFNFLKIILNFSKEIIYYILFLKFSIFNLTSKFLIFLKSIYKYYFLKKINLFFSFFLIYFFNFFFNLKYFFFFFFIKTYYKKRNFAFLELLGILFSIKKDLKRRHKLLMNQKFRQKMDFRDLNLQEFVNQIIKEEKNNDFFLFLNLKKKKDNLKFYKLKKNLIYNDFSQQIFNKRKKIKNFFFFNCFYNQNFKNFINLNYFKFYHSSLTKFNFFFKIFGNHNLDINFLLRKLSFIDIFKFSQFKIFFNFLKLDEFLKIKYLNLENKFKLKILNKNNFFIDKKIIYNKNFSNFVYKNKFKFFFIQKTKKKIKFIYFFSNFTKNLNLNNSIFLHKSFLLKNKKFKKTKRIILLNMINSQNMKKKNLSILKKKK